MKNNYNVPTEAEEQATLFSWAAMNSARNPELRLMFHIPNGGARKPSEAARFKAEGVKPGVPDIFLPVARAPFHGLFIELKRQKGGKISEHQKKWIEDLLRQGYMTVVACGWKEASEYITEYLNSKEW